MTEHPHWCVGCDGTEHRSIAYTVPANDVTDTEANTQLCTLGSQVLVQFVLATTHDDRPLVLSPDPVFVTEPHAHDLTIDQARQLHHQLGELLATIIAG